MFLEYKKLLPKWFLLVLSVALFFSLVPSLFRRDWAMFFGHIWEILIVVLILYFIGNKNTKPKNIILRLSTFYYTVVATIIYVALGLGAGMGTEGVRIQLFSMNSVLLAASVALLSVGVLILEDFKYKLFIIILGIIAILNTGSRAALIALIISVLMWLILSLKSYKRWLYLTTMVLLLFSAVLLSYTTQNYVDSVDNMINSNNILHDSNNFSSKYWLYPRNNSLVSVRPKESIGPFIGEKADRIIGKSLNNSNLLIYQNAGFAIPGKPYIGSIYLASDVPQTIVLSNKLSQVECNVTQQWSRCITPPGYGNTKSGVQLRLETIEKGDDINIYAWGAQLEIGEQVSDLQVKYKTPLLYYRIKRFSLSNLTGQTEGDRFKAMIIAWQEFLSSPIIGVGSRQDNSNSEIDTSGLQISHAHNLFLYLLARDGIMGLLAWLLPFIGIISIAWRAAKYKIIPIVTVIILVNLTDAIYYNAEVYYLFWIIMGVIIIATTTNERKC